MLRIIASTMKTTPRIIVYFLSWPSFVLPLFFSKNELPPVIALEAPSSSFDCDKVKNVNTTATIEYIIINNVFISKSPFS